MANPCEEFRKLHPAGPEGHLSSCADCRAFAKSWDLLREYPPIEPSPDFWSWVRRKKTPILLRFAAPIATAAAALLMAVILYQVPSAPAETVTEEERELVENLELLENYELLRTLEMVGENGFPPFEEKK